MAPWSTACTTTSSPGTPSTVARVARPVSHPFATSVMNVFRRSTQPLPSRRRSYETLFHDIPLRARRKTIPRTKVEDRKHTTLQLRRDLRLASLRAPALLKWKVASALVWGPPKQYGATARWAKVIHDQFQEVQGLIWTSRRCDPHSAMLLFGDRTAEADLEVVGVRDGRDASFLRDVREAGEQAGIVITE